MAIDSTVRQLLVRALRLINEPGRGMDPDDDDLSDAFDVFMDIVNSEGVSRLFRPGIRTHFFNVNSAQFIYTYGPGGEFDSNDFNDGVPVAVESAYLRADDDIVNNEKITNGEFEDGTNDWTLGAGWSVLNAQANFNQSVGDGTLSQALAWTTTTVYLIKFDVVIDTGAANFSVDGGLFTTDITASGSYVFEYTAVNASTSLAFASVNASGDKYSVDNISIIEKGKEKVELRNGNGRAGSDYPIRIMDQRTFNREFSKGTGGRPDKLLFSRSWPLAEIKFDQLPTFGEVLIMDVTTIPTHADVNTVLQFHTSSYKYLRYQIASDIAPEYGKELSAKQERTLTQAKNLMYVGNKRQNTLRMDHALLGRRRYNINQGDY